jgi:competence protein ComEC
MPDRMTFQFLDVGMGDGTLVQIREAGKNYDKLILVDFGEKRTQYKVPYQNALAYLVQTIAKNSTARGSKRPFVDYLFLTHPDGDHYNKIAELVDSKYPGYAGQRLHFGDLYFSGRKGEYGDLLTATLKGLVDAGIDEMPQGYHSDIVAGIVTPMIEFNNAQLYVLSANWPKTTGAKNPKSIVLQFHLEGQSVILPGDAEGKTEAQILKTFGAGFVKSTGLKLGHHGSKKASSPAWVKATSPKAIFASGDSAWSHPYCQAICRFIDGKSLRDWVIPFYYCCGNAGEYYDNPTQKMICMNLNYIVKSGGGEHLIDSDGKKMIAFLHNTFGVQWALQIDQGAAQPELLSTPLVEPDKGQKIPPPWDCKDKVAEPAGCETQTPNPQPAEQLLGI